MSHHLSSKRFGLFAVLVILIGGGIIYRLFNLTFVRHADYARFSKLQQQNPNSRLKDRGNIFFSGDDLAATNRSFLFLFSNNNLVGSPEKTADILAPILNRDRQELLALLSQKGKEYVVLAEEISREQSELVSRLKIAGLEAAGAVDRFYPYEFSGSSVLGFVGFSGVDRVGQYGVEAFYDALLSGREAGKNWFGNRTYSKASGFIRGIFDNSEKESGLAGSYDKNGEESHGSSVALTLDRNIQSFVESKLNSLISKWEAPSGLILVQEPSSGAILAMASSPSFNPNNYENFPLDSFVNPATQKLFEPGSSFKPITMAGALDKGAIKPGTVYEDRGAAAEAGFVIKNFDGRAHGVQTMTQVLEKSLNTGAIFAQERLGNDGFLNYVVAFGFGQKTGVDLSGEINGNISNLYTGRRINFMTASFGQGIAVTPIQLINAYSAIANGGKLMRPFLLKEIIRPDGSRVAAEPKVLGQPIADKTALVLKSMLTDAVNNGFDKARIAGYDVAGKTGTAQISSGEGGYIEDEVIHNFVGFAPSYNPKFVVLVKMDRPKGERFASNTLTSVFAEITKFLLNYYDVPPSRR